METLPLLLLQTLSGRYGLSYSLEELSSLLFPVLNGSATLQNHIASEIENQSKVLEALIILDKEGHVFLNPFTDKSAITVKGLIKLDNKVFCN